MLNQTIQCCPFDLIHQNYFDFAKIIQYNISKKEENKKINIQYNFFIFAMKS